MAENALNVILAKTEHGESLTVEDVSIILGLKASEDIETLFRKARELRDRFFGSYIFLYGFLYVSTYCRNDCSFCFFRRSNTVCQRYRKEPPDILAAASRLAESGIHLIDLTMGEDPALYNGEVAGFTWLIELVRTVWRETRLPIMVSPGVVPQSVLKDLHAAGASWYACYQETHHKPLFDRLRPGQDYDLRLQSKIAAQRVGLLIEEGLMCGIGETSQHIIQSMAAMQDLNADQLRVMKFIPQPGTPMGAKQPADSMRETLIIAIMRLMFPDRLIPASLDVDGLAGLRQRLDAGANVVTSIVPPGRGLAGVARHSLDIEDGKRTIESVHEVIRSGGLNPAGRDVYIAWLNHRRKAMARIVREGKRGAGRDYRRKAARH